MKTAIGLLLCACAITGASAAAVSNELQQTAGRGSADQPPASQLTILLPSEDAQLTVDGRASQGRGTSRTITLPPTTSRAALAHRIEVSFRPNAYTTIHRSRLISVSPGETVTVDLTRSSPDDRGEVIYVPTPYDVARRMVTLAGVTRDDVVFELGCGDARIAITALQTGGARRGVGIDIDEKLVSFSQENVRGAGLSDRLEIRRGDVFDDRATTGLNEATVVFMYLSDELDLLLRPKLLRMLKPGTRIVSHRFLMGDWQPDRTEVVVSGDAEYRIHLWTVKADSAQRFR